MEVLPVKRRAREERTAQPQRVGDVIAHLKKDEFGSEKRQLFSGLARGFSVFFGWGRALVPWV